MRTASRGNSTGVMYSDDFGQTWQLLAMSDQFPEGTVYEEGKIEEMPDGSYTTSLFRDGVNRMAQKVGEEALEMVIEATGGTTDRMIYEGSDMLYHLIVLLTAKGVRIEDLARELQERHAPGWKKH